MPDPQIDTNHKAMIALLLRLQEESDVQTQIQLGQELRSRMKMRTQQTKKSRRRLVMWLQAIAAVPFVLWLFHYLFFEISEVLAVAGCLEMAAGLAFLSSLVDSDWPIFQSYIQYQPKFLPIIIDSLPDAVFGGGQGIDLETDFSKMIKVLNQDSAQQFLDEESRSRLLLFCDTADKDRRPFSNLRKIADSIREILQVPQQA